MSSAWSVEEQQAHFNGKLAEWGVQIATCEDRGRSIVATRDLPAGSIVLAEAAFVTSLHATKMSVRW